MIFPASFEFREQMPPSHMHRWISNLGPQSRHCLDVTRLSNTRAAPSPKCSPEFIEGEGSSAPRGCIVACGLKSCDHHPPTGRHQSQRRTSLPISPWLTWSGLLFLLFLENWWKLERLPVGPTAVPESIFPTPSPYTVRHLGSISGAKPPLQVFSSVSRLLFSPNPSVAGG